MPSILDVGHLSSNTGTGTATGRTLAVDTGRKTPENSQIPVTSQIPVERLNTGTGHKSGTGIHALAANDPLMGLISGTAPDPASELPVDRGLPPIEPDTGKKADDEAGKTRLFRKLDLASGDQGSGSQGLGGARYIDMDGDTMTIGGAVERDEFIQWWAIDIWKTIAFFSSALKIDMSAILTVSDKDIEQGRKAAAQMYEIAERNPAWLGWMLSGATIKIGDFLCVLMFFGGKLMVAGQALYAAWKEKKRSAVITNDIVGEPAND